jgi:hypothetical protein
MMLHGKSEGGYEIIDDDASGSCKENKPALNSLQDDKEGQDVPKRCFQCECNKSKFARRRALAPTLEAIIGTKILTVSITPELPLEAVVRGTNVNCYVTLQK